MSKKGFRISGSFLAIVSLFTLLTLSLTCVVYAYEKEIVLGEVYQTEKEKERYKVSFRDRFALDLNFGIGGYYGGASNLQILGIDPDVNTYVKNLGMDYSETVGAIRLTATFFITPQFAVYIGAPFGVVTVDKEQEGLAQFFEEDDLKVGVGDIYGGLALTLLSGTEAKPNIAIFFNADADTSKFYSLGDGLWDFTVGGQINQLLSRSFYVFGTGDYTYRLKKKDIDPGNIVGYGGGFGFLLSGKSRIEAGLRAHRYYETKFDSRTLFKEADDLAFNLKFASKLGSMNFIIGNLNEGFEFGKNTVVLEYTIPLY